MPLSSLKGIEAAMQPSLTFEQLGGRCKLVDGDLAVPARKLPGRPAALREEQLRAWKAKQKELQQTLS